MARLLPNDDILRLMRNPLLRSTGVLSGLFYEFVIVTESDADRAFYQEVNERLLRFRPELGIPNCLFINAQNKQTVQTIIRPLRELGIPAAGVLDIDALKDGGTPWGALTESAYVPEVERNALATMRASVRQRFDATGKDMKKEGGLRLLNSSDREGANNLLERLAEGHLLFIVPNGELESWLKHLGVSGHGPNWLVSMFEKLGEDAKQRQRRYARQVTTSGHS